MAKQGIAWGVRFGAAICFLMLLVINFLAFFLPLNGVETEQIANFYPNLFVPANGAFYIWVLIYILLALYTLYQLGVFQKHKLLAVNTLMNRVGLYFAISSLANAAWLFSWHYNYIAISFCCMLVVLFCLLHIHAQIQQVALDVWGKFFIHLPFSIYFAWGSVMAMVNFAVLLVHGEWLLFGLSDVMQASMLLNLGLIITLLTAWRQKDIAYILTITWAYAGVLYKHLSVDGFNGEYFSLILTVSLCIAALLFSVCHILWQYKARRKH